MINTRKEREIIEKAYKNEIVLGYQRNKSLTYDQFWEKYKAAMVQILLLLKIHEKIDAAMEKKE